MQDEDARKERALAKEAKAAERKKDREELAEAKEFCRKLANGPSPRSKAVVVSEAELLKFGDVKVQSRIIFGGAGETRLIFTLWHGAWKVELDAKSKALEEVLKLELNKSGLNLWNVPKPEQKPAVAEDKQKGKLDIAVQAVDALLTCSRDWQDFTALPKSKQKKADVYRAMVNVQLAILTTLKALKRDVENEGRKHKGRKLQLAFEWLTGQGTPSQIVKLCDHAVNLAAELQRPPYKSELRADFELRGRIQIQPTNFAGLLKRAGLSWLPKKSR